jgi:hypothetical protein
MKYWILISVLFIGYGLEEPDPINESEANDEVAKAQRRSKWLGCLTIASVTLEGIQTEIETILSQTKHKEEDVVQKFVVDIIEPCLNLISYTQAEKILNSEITDDLKELIDKVTALDTAQFENKTVEFNPKQLKILNDIFNEIQTYDDGFDQPPPIVPEVVEELPDSNLYFGLAGFGILGFLALCFLGRSSKEQTKEEVKKKKRE